MRQLLKLTFLLSSFLWFSYCFASDNNHLEANKKAIIAFYNAAFNEKNFDKAAVYLEKNYKQHSPHVADGIEGLKNFIQKTKEQYPKTRVEIKKIFAEGNYVFLYVHLIKEPNTRGFAIMDIFKFDNGKIIEHWGVSQEVPEISANPNGMF